ncbi:hypothetical protein JOE38_002347 [Clavibacter michiganensis]|uniref:CypD family RiPP peptide-cysteine decarboxylase n=1 Tax=Clavibacter michiganensis TaxID=28447 RepID=UPI00195A5AF5|nr:CypD family RiPP peptide-cysteine decarboxylase [Clavibacter michiganensis]MBM7412524.1 hypothetical protein [Clavibacter michiganensis]
MSDPGFSPYQGSELHIHVSGSVSAALVPWWIHWLRHVNPEVIVNVSVSTRAQRFVSLDALRELSNGEAWSDDWSAEGLPHSWRRGRSGNAQCIIVFPATLDTVMRLSQGRADTPAHMMMQITELPIIVAEVSPADNAVITHWRDLLRRRSNVSFVPQLQGVRADDRTPHGSGFNLPGAIEIANAAISG